MNNDVKAYLLIVTHTHTHLVKQTPPIKAPDFIYMFSDSKHYTPATLVIAVHCLQYPIIQDTPGVPEPSCDQSHVKSVKLIQ